jgi:signal transduction histidine kinase
LTSRPSSARQEVARFAAAGLVALLLVGGLTAYVSQRAAQSNAIDDATRSTEILARGVVQPALTPAFLSGNTEARNALGRIIRTRVLDRDLVRVKLWDDQGTIVYSDEPRLIDATYGSKADELAETPTAEAQAEITDLAASENRFEREFTKLLEVYLPLEADTGERLLFEAYYRYDAVSGAVWDNWRAFAPSALGGLVALQLVLLPLAWRMARRLQDREQERERLLRRAIEASDAERRRIASYLHDGVVQDLAGVSFSLAAAAGQVDETSGLRAALQSAADQTRQGVRALRSLLVEIYPPNVHGAGLAAALNDLAAPLPARGVDVTMEMTDVPTDPASETLVFKVAQEALRNVVSHAAADRVALALRTTDGSVEFTVDDNGRGFPPEGVERVGHFGLRLLQDLAQEAGGGLFLERSKLGGARVRLEVPTA